MRRLILVLLLVGAVPSSAWAACTGASPTWTASPDYASVSACVASAVAGDTINITAGSVAWTTQLVISKAISIIGAGKTLTVITDNVPKGAAGDTTCLIIWNVQATGQHRLSNLQLHGGITGEAEPYNTGMVRIYNSTGRIDPHFRIDNVIVHPTRTCGLRIYNVIGVIDHSDFIMDKDPGVPPIDSTWGAKFGIIIGHLNWAGVGDYGDNSWAQSVTYGSNAFLFVEDCTFTKAWGYHAYAVDGWEGQRVVYRHNTFTNATWANHGTEASGRWRSARAAEIYENTFVFNDANFSTSSAVGPRGGTTIVYNNTLTISNGATCNYFLDYQYYRASQVVPVWGQSTGSSVWDENSDGYGYLALDQPGAGSGDYMSGYDPTPATWPHQVHEPCYAWGNTRNGSTLSADQGYPNVPTLIVENRDFYKSAKPGYTAYQYPHPLTGASLPAAPTNVRIR